MFQEFPYTNFHQLNLDWIVKIAKDFLDQYTHIQEVIQTGLDDLAESRETGLAELDQKRLDSLAELNQKTLDGMADLQEKYDTLNGLLQAWYDTHSEDIAGQLADAIADFNAAAEAKSQELLDSWPADYSELVTGYNNLKSALYSLKEFTDEINVDLSSARVEHYNINGGKWDDTQGYCYLVPVFGYDRVKITAPSGYNPVYSFLKSSKIGNNITPDFCDGYNDRIILAAGTSVLVDIPKDCAFMSFTKENGAGAERSPSSVVLTKINTDTLLQNGIVYNPSKFASGGIDGEGKTTTTNTRICSTLRLAFKVKRGDIVYSDGKYEFRVHIYNNTQMADISYIGVINDWTAKSFRIPDEYVGKEARLVIRKVGYESSDISSDVDDVYNHLSYIVSDNEESKMKDKFIDGNQNLLTLSKRVYSGYGINSHTGDIETNASVIVYDLIPINPGVIYAKNIRNSIFQNANGGLITPVFNPRTTKNLINNVAVINVPDGAAYIRTCALIDDAAYLYQFNPTMSKQQNSYYSGKKMIVIGDSVPQGYSLENKEYAFPKQIADYFGMTLINYSIGGSTIAKHEGDYDDIFFSVADFYSASKQQDKKYLVKNDVDSEHPFQIYSYSGEDWEPTSSTAAAYNGRSPMVDVITGADTDADVVFVMGGANDFMYHFTPFGEMTDREKTTFFGALHVMCQYILQTYVNKQVFFCGALHRYQVIGQGTADWNCDSPDAVCPTTGKTLGDYMDAIKEVCAYYAIPFIDLTSISGFAPPWETSLYNDTNGSYLHPTVAGHTRLASIIGAYMESMRL